MSKPPEAILTWLHENKHHQPSRLLESLVKANYPEDKAKSWVCLFFKEHAPEMLKSDLTELNSSKTEVVFVPKIEVSEFFPNALKSSDFGLHPISLNCEWPRVLHVLNVLTPSECERLIQESFHKLTPSTVLSNNQTDNFNAKHGSRTSYGTFFHRSSFEWIKVIDNRLSEIFAFPLTHGESLQILNYKIGAEYKPHYDYFDPETEGGKAAIGRAGNRVATIVMYLNDCSKGGGTVFPKLNLQIMPIQGSAVYFEYPEGAVSAKELTLHGGTPVLAGEKWIATKWVRARPWN